VESVKRICAVLAVLVIVALAAGCAKKPPKTEEPAPPPATEPGAGQTPVPTPPVSTGPEGGLDIENMTLDQLNAEVAKKGLLRDIHFDFDRYLLRDDARGILKDNVAFLLEYPSLAIQIEGNCDERGTDEYNLALGDKRARAAEDYLKRAGLATGRLSTVSFGEERPLDPGHNEEAWAKNRRAHFKIVGK
jgi:peptidoglycan-associated lipoprotein